MYIDYLNKLLNEKDNIIDLKSVCSDLIGKIENLTDPTEVVKTEQTLSAWNPLTGKIYLDTINKLRKLDSILSMHL
jgi:hypothetical protein